jgi:hypothetical protein
MRLVGASVVALALAAGPLASGASAADIGAFSGMGTGYALRVAVDLNGLPDAVKGPIQTAYTTLRDGLPAEAQALLPEDFPFAIDQRFIETLAEMGSAQKAQAFLSHGLIDYPEAAEASGSSDSDEVSAAEKNLPSDDLPVLSASAAELAASISEGPKVDGTGLLDSVSASLEQLSALFPAELQTALDDVVTQVNGAVSTAQTALDGVLGDVATDLVGQVTDDPALGGLLDDAGLGDVLGGVDPVADATALTTELQNALQLNTLTDLLTGPVASVEGVRNGSHSEKTAEKAFSEAASTIDSVDVLGLLSAEAIDLESHSEAAGTPGSATNDSSCSIAAVNVGGQDGVALDGETLTVAGAEVPVPTDQVDAVKGVAHDVLDAIGVVDADSIDVCDTETDADEDGTAAAQRVSAFHVELALKAPADVGSLIGAGDELVRLVIDPSVQTAAAAQPAPTVSEPEVSLPRTGAPLVGTLLSGIGLAAGALFMRRRFF